MKGRRALLLLVVALAIAGVAGILAIHERTPPVSPVEIVPTTWRTARETPMHEFHVGTKKIACSECHAAAGAEDAGPTAASCTKCHERQASHGHRGNPAAETTCLSCHVFGGGKRVAQCADCHANGPQHGAKALAHHSDAKVACGACHAIHGSDRRAVLADCTSCHESASAMHGRFSVHASHAAGAEPTRGMPAMDAAVLAFLREGGAPPTALAHGDGSVAPAPMDPRTALPGEVCSACHAPHAGKETARETCASCHLAGASSGPNRVAASSRFASASAPTIAPRGARVAGHESCLTCHEPHRATAKDARACESCHGDHRGALATKGHPTCRGCHAAHSPMEARSSCSTCHAATTTLASSRVPAHADCASCHDAHRPEAAAEVACVRCHETVKPSHPNVTSAKGGGACVGCHAPHGGAHGSVQASASATAQACSTCHRAAADDRSFHAKATTCTQCHAPHAFRLSGGSATRALCATCHAAKATATAGRPGHANCEGCHAGAHAPAAKPSCQPCHAQEASSTTKGHATCTSCHDAHSGSLGARATCTSCHANKKNALHASMPSGSSPVAGGHESCATCHRAHGPKGVAQPAACSSCHARPSLAGLHGVGAHATCETCHSAHGPPRSDRATCTGSCHANQRNHQPEAKVCKGCHVFRH